MKYTESIITKDMNRCYKCGVYSITHTHIHHIFGASNRDLSSKYGLVVPLCQFHHTGSGEAVHFNKQFMDELHALGQKRFNEEYPDLDFIKIFGRNYL